MEVSVFATEDPAVVLERARSCLAADPVRCNVVLTLLHTRVTHPEPGRYWVAYGPEGPLGVVFQSPLDFVATCTPMPAEAVAAAADAVAGAGVDLPGVNGEVATAARFAGRWTEAHRTAATPDQGQRVYEVSEVRRPDGVAGGLRQAEAGDRALLVDWTLGFQVDTGESRGDPGAVVGRRLPAGHLWVWEVEGHPVSMAGLSPPVEGVTRVGPVYTPPEQRGHGYASACVAALSARALGAGHRCILYTDLGNPTSNGIYRAIGYQAVAEAIRYRFG